MNRFAGMLTDVLESLFSQPVTENYPYETINITARYRARISWFPEACTGCGLCAKDCPADAIQMIVLDRKAKRFVMQYNLDKCTFCGQCMLSCHKEALVMTSDGWELAELSREPYRLLYGDPNDIAQVLAKHTRPNTDAA